MLHLAGQLLIYVSVNVPKCTDTDRITFPLHLAPYTVSESEIDGSRSPFHFTDSLNLLTVENQNFPIFPLKMGKASVPATPTNISLHVLTLLCAPEHFFHYKCPVNFDLHPHFA